MQTAQKRETGPTFAFESDCRRSGYRVIAGIDEAGRGALAGPVVAGAVVLPADMSQEHIDLIDDSKKLSTGQRERAFDVIRTYASAYGVGVVPNDRIDELGIVPSTKLAMRGAIRAIRWRIDFLLIDAVTNIGIATPSKSIIRGDSKSLSIAAASIVAKSHTRPYHDGRSGITILRLRFRTTQRLRHRPHIWKPCKNSAHARSIVAPSNP